MDPISHRNMENMLNKNAMVTFGIVADLQYCDSPPMINRYFRKAPDKLRRVIETFNRRELDFIINLGDLIDRDWESFDRILPLFDEFKARTYHVLGNHDFEVDDHLKVKVPGKLGTRKHYDFSLKNWRFIVLDGNEISTFGHPEHSDAYQKAERLLKVMEHQKKVNANYWNGAIGGTQLDWLCEVLDQATGNHENVAIICHFPVYPVHLHNLLNDEQVLEIITGYDCVKVWLNGHNHEGNYGMFGDIHFVNFRGMVDTEFEMAFSIIHLSDKQIIVEGFGSEISTTLSIYPHVD